jgi:hypothetical protein
VASFQEEVDSQLNPQTGKHFLVPVAESVMGKIGGSKIALI